MVSASKDGAFLVEILRAFDIEPVRGSTSRRGRQALLELSRQMKAGLHLAITPDGPRGPCYEIQDGILSLAQVTGLPIIPLGVPRSESTVSRVGTGFNCRCRLPVAMSNTANRCTFHAS